MNRTFSITAVGIVSIATAAFSSDAFIEDCEAFKEANGIGGDCACMAEAASAQGVADEIMAMDTLDDFDGLSNTAKDVVEQCGEA